MDDERQLGLFLLPLVLLPGETVPLHVFEERYRRLVEGVLDGGEFGVVLVEDDAIVGAGCSARVVDVVARHGDGSLDVLVRGVRRFAIRELVEPDDPERECLRARVAFFDDDDGEAPPALQQEVGREFRDLLRLLDVAEPHLPPGEGPLSFRLATALDLGPGTRQRLLEARRETERLEFLRKVFAWLRPRLELRKQREDAIRGNGKGY